MAVSIVSFSTAVKTSDAGQMTDGSNCSDALSRSHSNAFRRHVSANGFEHFAATVGRGRRRIFIEIKILPRPRKPEIRRLRDIRLLTVFLFSFVSRVVFLRVHDRKSTVFAEHTPLPPVRFGNRSPISPNRSPSRFVRVVQVATVKRNPTFGTKTDGITMTYLYDGRYPPFSAQRVITVRKTRAANAPPMYQRARLRDYSLFRINVSGHFRGPSHLCVFFLFVRLKRSFFYTHKIRALKKIFDELLTFFFYFR